MRPFFAHRGLLTGGQTPCEHIYLIELQFREIVHDIYGLDADVDDGEQQVEDVAGLVDCTIKVLDMYIHFFKMK